MSKTLLSKNLSAPQLAEVEKLMMGGISSDSIADVIQSEWGLLSDVSHAVVTIMATKHLQSLHKQKPVEEPPAVVEQQFNPLEEILALAKQQRARVDMALAKEKDVGIPMDTTAKAMKDLQETSALMQRMQIEYDIAQGKKPPILGGKPLTVEQRISEAVRASERIMNRNLG